MTFSSHLHKFNPFKHPIPSIKKTGSFLSFSSTPQPPVVSNPLHTFRLRTTVTTSNNFIKVISLYAATKDLCLGKMIHASIIINGGSNFGRTTSAFTTTFYYDEAPLDSYGLQREPEWSHLTDVHKAISLCKKALLNGEHTTHKISQYHEIIVYEKKESDFCVAFITNNYTQNPEVLKFRGSSYYLPPRSINILPGCKTVVFNTQNIASQHNSRNFERSKVANNHKWEVYTELIPTSKELPAKQKIPAELYSLLKDTIDYGWYITRLVSKARNMEFSPRRDQIK